jgi:glycosyltransferase involved in cell wall biosynthesis
MKNSPLVSYIIPNYNQTKFLYDAISSIELSYSGPKEIIVVDDCSQEPFLNRKLEEIKKRFKDVRIIAHEKNEGLSASRNTGINNCNGEYIQFLDADDILLPRKVDHQLHHLCFGNRINISVSDFFLCDETLSEFTRITPGIGNYSLSCNDFLFSWERGLTIPIHSALFPRNIFSDCRFDETLTAKEDWLFWCSQVINHKIVAFLNIPGAGYRQHNKAMTKINVAEMGRMWLKSSAIIDNLLGHSNEFVDASLNWYHRHYENAPVLNIPDITQGERISKSKFLSKNKNTEQQKREHPFFSIIVPIYNHFEYLEQCISSLLEQSFYDFEIICVDDASSDKRVQELLNNIVDKYSEISIIFNKNNSGISTSINNGIEVSKGKYLVFVDCDDYLPKDALIDVYQQLIKDENIDYLFTDKIDIDKNNKFIRKAVYGGYSHITPSGNILDDLLDGMVASHLKVIKRKTIIEVGLLNPIYDGVQDYELALRIAKSGKFKHLSKPLYFHRQHNNSITTSDTIQQFRNENIVRRIAFEAYFPKSRIYENTDELSLKSEIDTQISDTYEENNEAIIFTSKKYSLESIKREKKNGKICIFDARNENIGEWIYFLREYNSYFDQIIVDKLELAAFLLCYLWDYRILRIV